MGLRQGILIAVFGVHWAVFVRLFVKRRRWSQLLPVGVFTFLILTQLFWHSTAELSLGGYGPVPLRTAFRHSAWTLAVPSLFLMFRRISLRIQDRRMRVKEQALAELAAD